MCGCATTDAGWHDRRGLILIVAARNRGTLKLRKFLVVLGPHAAKSCFPEAQQIQRAALIWLHNSAVFDYVVVVQRRLSHGEVTSSFYLASQRNTRTFGC